MSRMYSFQFTAKGYQKDRVDAIREAVAELGYGFDVTPHPGSDDILDSSKEDLNLSAARGETEETVAADIAKAVWKGNGVFCEVKVHSVDIDVVPCETHEFDEYDYDQIMD